MRRWSDFPSDNADRSVRTWLVQTLQAHGQGALGEARECKAIADRLMAALDDRSRTLLEALDRRYDESELNRLGQALDRVLDGEPVQYAVGWTEFRGLRIACGPEALIPRPETEEVVSWFLEGMERAASAMGWRQGIRVLDVGTGSGCMALAIKAAKPAWEVWGLDQSAAALERARQNGHDLGLEVQWVEADALSPGWGGGAEVFHGVVSNPPYIPASEAASMDAHVRQYEPGMALFVPDDAPLCFYEALLAGARSRLHRGGCMVAECHAEFTQKVADCWQLEAVETEVLCDLQGAERAVRLIRH